MLDNGSPRRRTQIQVTSSRKPSRSGSRPALGTPSCCRAWLTGVYASRLASSSATKARIHQPLRRRPSEPKRILFKCTSAEWEGRRGDRRVASRFIYLDIKILDVKLYADDRTGGPMARRTEREDDDRIDRLLAEW